MSFIAALPFGEIMAALVGVSASTAALFDLVKSRKNSQTFSDALKKRREWREFEAKRLQVILADNEIDEAEWAEIINLVDSIVMSNSKIIGWREMRSLYPARSQKAKKILLSEVITRQSKISAGSTHEFAS